MLCDHLKRTTMDSHPLQHGEKNLKNNGVYLKLEERKTQVTTLTAQHRTG
jgi:hypothetical protein